MSLFTNITDSEDGFNKCNSCIHTLSHWLQRHACDTLLKEFNMEAERMISLCEARWMSYINHVRTCLTWMGSVMTVENQDQCNTEHRSILIEEWRQRIMLQKSAHLVDWRFPHRAHTPIPDVNTQLSTWRIAFFAHQRLDPQNEKHRSKHIRLFVAFYREDDDEWLVAPGIGTHGIWLPISSNCKHRVFHKHA